MRRGHTLRKPGRTTWSMLLLLVTAAAMSGCSDAGSNPAGGTPTSSILDASAVHTSESAPSSAVSDTVASSDLDSSAQTSDPATSQSERLSNDEALHRYLSEAAKSLGVTGQVPDVEIVRRIKPEEKVEVLIQCLRDKGFPVKEQGTGAFSIDVPPEQQGAAALAHYECLAAYPPEARFLQPMGTEQYKAIYRYYTETLVPCLVENGYPQTDPAPTEQTFLDTLGTPEEWNPYSAVPDGGGTAQSDELKRACPQEAPSDSLFPPN